jgi:hypothetical protein
MKDAVLTTAGAYRIGHEELVGQIVQYDEITQSGLCAKNVFYNEKRISGILSISGDEQGLILCERNAVQALSA